MSIFDEPRPQKSAFPDATDAKLKNPGDAVEGKVVEVSPRVKGKFGHLIFVVLETDDGKHVRVMAPVKTSDRTGNEYGMGKSFERFGGAVGDRAGFKFEGLNEKGYREEDVRVVKANPESLFD